MRYLGSKIHCSLEDNNFSGQVPAQLGELTKLKVSIKTRINISKDDSD